MNAATQAALANYLAHGNNNMASALASPPPSGYLTIPAFRTARQPSAECVTPAIKDGYSRNITVAAASRLP